jgi:hypothetical protein
MENKFEEKLKLAYEEYLKLPKPTIENRNAELYANGWCVMTGRSIIAPHPHRHYTFTEFVYWCGKDKTLHARFIDDSPAGDGSELKNKLIKICDTVQEDVEKDAKEFDGKPFDGKTMAEYMGYHGAAIGALADVLRTLIDKVPDEYFTT